MCGSDKDARKAYSPKLEEIKLRQIQLDIIEGMTKDIPWAKDYLLGELGIDPETGDTGPTDDLLASYEARQADVMEGDIPISPALEKELEQERGLLDEKLSRKGISSGDTSYIQSMDKFDTRAGLLREEARRGMMTTGQDLISARSTDMSNEFQQKYGLITQPPGYSLLTPAGQAQAPYQYDRGLRMDAAIAKAQTTSQATTASLEGTSNAICCFIFIAGHGFLHPIVRRYRDKHMTTRNRRGYYWLADRLVPLMEKNKYVKRLVMLFMINPMTHYGKYRYKYNKSGAWLAPVTQAWLTLFSLLGSRPPYTRRGTDITV